MRIIGNMQINADGKLERRTYQKDMKKILGRSLWEEYKYYKRYFKQYDMTVKEFMEKKADIETSWNTLRNRGQHFHNYDPLGVEGRKYLPGYKIPKPPKKRL
jgi:hypothetical protein